VIQAVFCGEHEDIHHLFVNCSTVQVIWNWIAKFNAFTFTGALLEDLWYIDYCIPLKDRNLVGLIRSVVCWVVWLERNNITFNHAAPSFKSLELKIINLTTFWCKARNTFQMLKLSLMLPQEVEDLPMQVGADTEEDLAVEDNLPCLSG
jgi:hypothetical protein